MSSAQDKVRRFNAFLVFVLVIPVVVLIAYLVLANVYSIFNPMKSTLPSGAQTAYGFVTSNTGMALFFLAMIIFALVIRMFLFKPSTVAAYQ